MQSDPDLSGRSSILLLSTLLASGLLNFGAHVTKIHVIQGSGEVVPLNDKTNI